MPGHSEYALDGEVVLREHQLAKVAAVTEREVSLGNAPVRLGQAHLRVVHHHVEERPGGIRSAQVGEGSRGQSRAEAVPPGQVESHLRPGEDPGDGTQITDTAPGRAT